MHIFLRKTLRLEHSMLGCSFLNLIFPFGRPDLLASPLPQLAHRCQSNTTRVKCTYFRSKRNVLLVLPSESNETSSNMTKRARCTVEKEEDPRYDIASLHTAYKLQFAKRFFKAIIPNALPRLKRGFAMLRCLIYGQCWRKTRSIACSLLLGF